MSRPTKYKEEYNEQARKLCLLGATDKSLADFFEVCEDTINEWKKSKDGFSESLRAGKEVADANVADSLYNRACGYSHEEERLITVSLGNSLGSTVERHNTIKHYPPDTQAALTWLKNRQGDKWRDKQEIEHAGEIKGANVIITLPSNTRDEET